MAILSDEQLMIRDMVREFAVAELEPLAARIDAEARFPSETLPKLAALNLLGLTVPLEHGGAGVDALCYAIALEEVAHACPSTAYVLLAHNSLAAASIRRWGSASQQHRWLGALGRGEKLGAFALSEAGAGSDMGAMQATATRQNGGWILHGTKTFVANATAADLFIVAARTDRDAAPERGIGLFVVERGAAGLSTPAPETMLGLRGAGIGRLVLDDVVVTDEAALGDPGAGLAACDWALVGTRLGLAAIGVGIAQGAFDRALRYARERPQFGKPIAEHQSVQARLADMAIEIEVARAVVHHAAGSGDPDLLEPRVAASAKIFATDVASRAGDHAIQVHGGYGYISEYHVERYYRDGQTCIIAYGTNEVLRLLVAQELVRES